MVSRNLALAILAFGLLSISLAAATDCHRCSYPWMTSYECCWPQYYTYPCTYLSYDYCCPSCCCYYPYSYENCGRLYGYNYPCQYYLPYRY
ncbi:MAG: hypothetical protein A4E48_02564 [Methanosaeta sp. PtaU1.Bin060]|nr:MAG: hypothetical protein A4E48_02564 [Methanosaeta sp. PtaU1.Bin060]